MLLCLCRTNSRRFGYSYYCLHHGQLNMRCPFQKCSTLRETAIQMKQKCKFCMDRSLSVGGDTDWRRFKTCISVCASEERGHEKRRTKLAYKPGRVKCNSVKWQRIHRLWGVNSLLPEFGHKGHRALISVWRYITDRRNSENIAHFYRIIFKIDLYW
jgi:hypothetical protein